MPNDGTQRAAGWLKYAGHEWPVERLELRQGVLRISVSGLVTHDVPAGTTPGEMYGEDGALVFRAAAMEHEDIRAGEFGGVVLNFFLPQLSGNEDVEINEHQLGVALTRLIADHNRDKPPTTTELLRTARRRWVNARRTAWMLLGLSVGDTALILGAPTWVGVSCSFGGLVTGMVYDCFDREWWKK